MNTIISMDRVIAKTTLGRGSIYAYVKAGNFPPPIKVGTRQIAWIESEVDAWIEKRIAASRPGQANEVPA